MAELDLLSDGPLKDEDRFRKSRRAALTANDVRQAACGAVYAHLGAGGADPAMLLSLQSADHDMRGHIAAHVAKWTSSAIAADWPAYCADSHALRWRLRSCVNSEQRFLYALLEAAAARTPDRSGERQA